jgi:glycosyltransferase involved in cell wall biosynthesis
MSKKTLVVISPFQTRSGYGQHSRLLIRSLLSIPEVVEKYDVRLLSIKWGGTPLTALNPNDPEDARLLGLLIPNNNLTFEPDVTIHISIPPEFQRIGKKSIGVSALTEASVLPVNMVEGLNRVDMCIVPSEFTKQVALQTQHLSIDKVTKNANGTLQVNKPIEVLFEGLDTNIYDKNKVIRTELTDYLNKTVEESFSFLFVGHWLNAQIGHDRKDVSMLVYTFFNTFKNRKNKPALILKSSSAGFSVTERDQIVDKVRQIQEMFRDQGYNGRFPNVYVLNGDLTEAQMNELYNHPKVKAMVSFTHGEGFGLPMLEFTSTGKPILCSNYSGPVDYLNPDFAELLPGKMIKIDRSAQNEWITDSEWFQVNYTYASKLLDDVFENYDKFLVRSRKQPKYTKDNFSFEKMTDKLKEVLEKYGLFEEAEAPRVLKLPKLTKAV